MFNKNKAEEYTEITLRDRKGNLKWQWQDNFVWKYLKLKTGKDIRVPILTGYPTRFYKFNAK